MDGHDRYLIYRMLGRQVEMTPPRVGRRRRRVAGRVDKVIRNIFDNVVELTVGGRTHSFKEPSAIVAQEEDVVFVYGGRAPAADDEVFRQAAEKAHSGETIHDVMRRTDGSPDRSLRFRLGPCEGLPRRPRARRPRVAVA